MLIPDVDFEFNCHENFRTDVIIHLGSGAGHRNGENTTSAHECFSRSEKPLETDEIWIVAGY